MVMIGLGIGISMPCVRFLFLALYAFTGRLGGTVFFAPLRIQVHEGKYREPDLLLLRNADDPRAQDAYWLSADLVMEVVSPDDRERDTVIKRADYAEAGIPEYWIVDPLDETITVLELQDSAYVEHGVFHRGEQATSVLLVDLGMSVDEVFGAVR